MRSFSYINSAKKIIASYDGSLPLAAWLKQFFKTEKKFGSTDRKQVTHLCYCYFRLGNAFRELETEERFLLGLFLCSDKSNIVLREQRPDWDEKVHLDISEKMRMTPAKNEALQIFPYDDLLSGEIDRLEFNRSFLIQPDLFLRIRPGKKARVLQQLQHAGIEFKSEDEDCLRLFNQSKINEVLKIDEDVVVQDLNSQKTMQSLLKFKPPSFDHVISVFDCCAASGGKSILIYDQYPKIDLTVSDIRETILFNLRKRLSRAGIFHYASFTADIADENFTPKNKYDIVICDAPCSGSGTWSRTPEQLDFFTSEKLDHYYRLQQKIILNVMKAVKPGGYLLYITCSVFRQENEKVIEAIAGLTSSGFIQAGYLKGYNEKADTLYTALLKID